MGFMRDQAPRLTRERWTDVNELAEELFAIWTSDKGVTLDGPVTINNTHGGSSLVINQGDSGDQAITINNNPVQPPDIGDVVLGDNSITIIYGDGETEHFDDPPPGPEQPQPGEGTTVVGGGGGGGVPCEVVSGSGFSYLCNIYTAGLGTTPIQAQVRFVGMSSAAEVPEGTQAIASLVAGSYIAYLACWV